MTFFLFHANVIEFTSSINQSCKFHCYPTQSPSFSRSIETIYWDWKLQNVEADVNLTYLKTLSTVHEGGMEKESLVGGFYFYHVLCLSSIKGTEGSNLTDYIQDKKKVGSEV